MDESEMKEHFGMLDDEDIANAELEARGLFTGMDFSQLEKHDPENEFKLRKLMNRIADQEEELLDARDHDSLWSCCQQNTDRCLYFPQSVL